MAQYFARFLGSTPRLREIGEPFYRLLSKAFYGVEDALEALLIKGAAHKYIRRVPTGKTTKTGKPIYKYHYRVTGGSGLAHDDEIVTGSAFKIDHDGKAGHFHITSVDGDKVTVRHDETGESVTMTRDEFRAMLHVHHHKSIHSALVRAERVVYEAEQHGTKAHMDRARMQLERTRSSLGFSHSNEVDSLRRELDAAKIRYRELYEKERAHSRRKEWALAMGKAVPERPDGEFDAAHDEIRRAYDEIDRIEAKIEEVRPARHLALVDDALERKADEEKRKADEEKRKADEEKRKADEEKKRASYKRLTLSERNRKAEEEKRKAEGVPESYTDRQVEGHRAALLLSKAGADDLPHAFLVSKNKKKLTTKQIRSVWSNHTVEADVAPWAAFVYVSNGRTYSSNGRMAAFFPTSATDGAYSDEGLSNPTAPVPDKLLDWAAFADSAPGVAALDAHRVRAVIDAAKKLKVQSVTLTSGKTRHGNRLLVSGDGLPAPIDVGPLSGQPGEISFDLALDKLADIVRGAESAELRLSPDRANLAAFERSDGKIFLTAKG